jgi:hypothetical protein
MQEQSHNDWDCGSASTRQHLEEAAIGVAQAMDDEKVIDLLRKSELFSLIKKTIMKHAIKSDNYDSQRILRDELEKLVHQSDQLSAQETVQVDD